MKKVIFGCLTAVVLVFACLIAATPQIFFFMFYDGDNSRQPEYIALLPVGEDVELGEGIVGRYYPAAGAGEKESTCVVYYHGNAGPTVKLVEAIDSLNGICLLLVWLPGYGLSTGETSEEGIYRAVDLSIRWLTANKVAEKDIVLIGHSMGSTAALYGAREYGDRIRGTVLLNAPSTGYALCAGNLSRVLPKAISYESLGQLLCLGVSAHDNVALATEAKGVVLQYHSEGDVQVPLWQADELAKGIGRPWMPLLPANGAAEALHAETIVNGVKVLSFNVAAALEPLLR